MDVSNDSLTYSWNAFIKRWNVDDMDAVIENREAERRSFTLSLFADKVHRICWEKDLTCLAHVHRVGC